MDYNAERWVLQTVSQFLPAPYQGQERIERTESFLRRDKSGYINEGCVYTDGYLLEISLKYHIDLRLATGTGYLTLRLSNKRVIPLSDGALTVLKKETSRVGVSCFGKHYVETHRQLVDEALVKLATELEKLE